MAPNLINRQNTDSSSNLNWERLTNLRSGEKEKLKMRMTELPVMNNKRLESFCEKFMSD